MTPENWIAGVPVSIWDQNPPPLNFVKKRALLTGTTGQDGSYLAEILLAAGYEVHGIKRRGSSFNTARIDHLMDNPCFHLHYADLTDGHSLAQVMIKAQPNEIYNLGAQSHVAVSFELPEYTADTVAMGTLRLLDAMRMHAPHARFYQASSSEMFGNRPAPQGRCTPFDPCSPYAVAKVFAHNIARHYRDAYGLWVVCGILFNHESPRRSETFVTRKITRGLARIKLGLQQRLALGNLAARRDWGYAPDYMAIVHREMQREAPQDFVIGTGLTASVEEWLDVCLKRGGLPPDVVYEDMRYMRPVEVNELRADVGDVYTMQAPTPWYEVAGKMMDADLVLAETEARCAR